MSEQGSIPRNDVARDPDHPRAGDAAQVPADAVPAGRRHTAAAPPVADREPAGRLLTQEAPARTAAEGGPPGPLRRVTLSPAAEDLLARLAAQHGPLMFHQSGGCCDGSSPMCYPRGEFRVGAADVLLGRVAGDTPFWMSANQYTYWRHTFLTVDVAPGRGSGFSVEAPEGVRFLLRSRLFTDAELALLDAEPPPVTGDGPAGTG